MDKWRFGKVGYAGPIPKGSPLAKSDLDRPLARLRIDLGEDAVDHALIA